MKPEQNLKKLGINLPNAHDPVGSYVASKIVGDFIYISGQVSFNIDGKLIKGTDRDLGGTMRLGSYEARLKKDTKISKIYNSLKIKERHRHRYEVNINYKEEFENKGMIFSGLSPDNKLPEIIELKDHPWFIGVQFHPEFKSRPLMPHPLFSSFIKAAKINSKK